MALRPIRHTVWPVVPSMTGAEGLRQLEALGREWTGRGVAAECGCWLGASAMALLRGLVAAGYDRPFWAFDRWTANESEVRKAVAFGVRLEVGEALRPYWAQNAGSVYPYVEARRCELDALRWPGGPCELLAVDAAKREPAFSHVMGEFLPWLVDGAVVALMDYGYWRRFGGARAHAMRCQERWMDEHKTAFAFVRDISGCGAVFRYTKEGG